MIMMMIIIIVINIITISVIIISYFVIQEFFFFQCVRTHLQKKIWNDSRKYQQFVDEIWKANIFQNTLIMEKFHFLFFYVGNTQVKCPIIIIFITIIVLIAFIIIVLGCLFNKNNIFGRCLYGWRIVYGDNSMGPWSTDWRTGKLERWQLRSK